MRYLPTSQLKDLLTTPDTPLPEDVLFYKLDTFGEIKGIDGTRQIRFVISTGGVDRDRDIINPTGWQLDNYRQNPVVQWAHDYRGLPIARAVEVGIANDQLYAVDEFPTADLQPFGDTVYQLLLAGYLRATSVGFRPLTWNYNSDRGGIDFGSCELLEHSVCPVPCNPQCLMDAKSQGIDIAPLKSWAEQTLDELSDEAGLWLPKTMVEQVFALLETKTISVPAPAPSGLPLPAQPGPPVTVLPDAATWTALARTVQACGMTPPWETQPAVWEPYVLLCRAVEDAGDDMALKAVAEGKRAALEAQLFPAKEEDFALDEEVLVPVKDQPDEEGIEVDPATLQQLIRETVGQAMMHITGRVPVN